MEPRYKLLENLPLSVWLYLKDFLQPTDLENILVTGSHLWKHIFKDTKWLEFAQTFDQYHAMKVLGPADMTTPNANPREVWDQPASDRESIESGCILKTWHMQKFEKLQIVPRRANGNARHRWPVMVNFETGEHYEHVLEDWDEFFERSTRQDPSFRDLFNRIMNIRR
ncbi:predicted protein [Aspergillus nidulans FGSC A4]|uniref:F-box domain-containing protein n=1 Tax=Emericella nidulans (strain FGSC A4 / ATCC 38163 / CBS 112.46 / NRRL 194 / M139) TaxID=227321 RepID=Q5B814_EMENI|nr:hypothetical protein [Aspergillus nidulans FGSC A4]EAA63284.1 predicted protein [Aspergillus nidulans FGSC A4]CBF82969.1 TPA: conserved hypothetical protein [Aspergillus nidulans FGSC A4]|eukprot:XP_660920.1 predicted protein [Aspergillus nidulans FGSC A4]